MRSVLEMRRVLIRQLRKAIQNVPVTFLTHLANIDSFRFVRFDKRDVVILPETEGNECLLVFVLKRLDLIEKKDISILIN